MVAASWSHAVSGLASLDLSGVAILMTALLAWASVAAAGEPQVRLVGGHELHQVLPPDAIPAVDRPRFVTAAEARAFMRAGEPVLGVAAGDAVKCYSAWLLERHEIVNDSLGDLPIAASW